MSVASNSRPRVSSRGRSVICAAAAFVTLNPMAAGRVEAAGSGKTIGPGPVTVYAQPFTTSGQLGTIPKDTTVTVECAVRGGSSVTGPYGPSNIWHNIKYNNRSAWIPDALLFTRSSFLAPGEVECKNGRIDTLGGVPIPVWSTPTSGVQIGTIANGSTITLYCGANGSSANGKWGSRTLWHMVGYQTQWGYVNDAGVNTGVEGLPSNEYWCPSTPSTPGAATPPKDKKPVPGVFAEARNRVGSSNVGGSTNEVHRWGAGEVQDFDKGSWGWNIIMKSDSNPSKAYVVRTGFWEWYRANNNQGVRELGFPLTDEFPYGAGARQGFQKGVLEWQPGRAVIKVNFAGPLCPKTYSFSCLERFGYGADTGTWADKRHPAPRSGNHNCTRFVAYYMAKYLGFDDPGAPLGEATDWGKTNSQGRPTYNKSLKAKGYLVNNTPAVGSIAWWVNTGDNFGHVGIVVQVGQGFIVVASDNYDATGYSNVLRYESNKYPDGFIHVENGPK